ncbi:RhuM family protein [Pedobacter heparinus]|uniref:RhuM family protein n=1 Tax=Pedobacter heparinus TaxID=984 RepID=UPI00292ED466|nr:RhuM family protein [Pedobacter heparinus]
MQTEQIIMYQTADGQTAIDVKLENETVWLSQSQLQVLFNQTKQNVSLHIRNIYEEGELDKLLTVKESLTVQEEGKRVVKRKIEYYNLDVIISTGYRVKSQRGTQFRTENRDRKFLNEEIIEI